MYLVEIVATLAMGRRMTEEELDHVIDALIDDLDELGLEPSIGTRRLGDDVRFTVDVTVDQAHEFDALTAGVAAIKSAFHAADVGTARFPVPKELHSRVLPQPA